MQCRCNRFITNVMASLGVPDLEKKHQDKSDMDLAFGEIGRLKRAEQLNAKLVDMLDDVHCRITEDALINKEGPFGGDKFFSDIGQLIKDAKASDGHEHKVVDQQYVVAFPTCVAGLFDSEKSAMDYVRDYFGDEDPHANTNWSIKPVRAP